MERKDFIEQVGMSGAALLVMGCFGSCTKSSDTGGGSTPNPNPNKPVDFTINISNSPYSSSRTIPDVFNIRKLSFNSQDLGSHQDLSVRSGQKETPASLGGCGGLLINVVGFLILVRRVSAQRLLLWSPWGARAKPDPYFWTFPSGSILRRKRAYP